MFDFILADDDANRNGILRRRFFIFYRWKPMFLASHNDTSQYRQFFNCFVLMASMGPIIAKLTLPSRGIGRSQKQLKKQLGAAL